MNYVLETENLTKDFGSFRALDRVSVKLEPGKIYGLIGRNGAGKTTLMRLAAGLSFPSEVSISLFGRGGEKASHQNPVCGDIQAGSGFRREPSYVEL